jgi:hypothetical protein
VKGTSCPHRRLCWTDGSSTPALCQSLYPSKLEDIVWRPEYTPVQECFFHFSAESIKRLKMKANAEMAGTATATISLLQSLLAHLWQAVCRAWGLAPHLETTYKLAIGCRARVKSIPQEYMGAKSTISDILDKGSAGRRGS